MLLGRRGHFPEPLRVQPCKELVDQLSLPHGAEEETKVPEGHEEGVQGGFSSSLVGKCHRVGSALDGGHVPSCPHAAAVTPSALKVPLHLGILLGSRLCRAPSDSTYSA